MKITTFTCKNCGANVDIPDSPGTAACDYSGSSHRVSFQDGSVIAELTAKVNRLDEDVARLKGGQAPQTKPPGLKERLGMIAEGKRKWHEYFSSVKAGKDKNAPEILAVFGEAQTNLIGGYGPASGPLIEDAYGAKLLGVDPPAGFSCLFMMIGLIILTAVIGAITLYEGDVKLGIILLGTSAAGIIAGIPVVIFGIGADRRDIARRKAALARLDEIEREIRRRMAADQGKKA